MAGDRRGRRGEHDVFVHRVVYAFFYHHRRLLYSVTEELQLGWSVKDEISWCAVDIQDNLGEGGGESKDDVLSSGCGDLVATVRQLGFRGPGGEGKT